MDHRTWINMNSRKLLETKGNEECVKTVTLDQVTITVTNAEQQLNTDTWDDELNADSRLKADSANSSIRTTTPNDNALGRHCANQSPLRRPSAS